MFLPSNPTANPLLRVPLPDTTLTDVGGAAGRARAAAARNGSDVAGSEEKCRGSGNNKGIAL